MRTLLLTVSAFCIAVSVTLAQIPARLGRPNGPMPLDAGGRLSSLPMLATGSSIPATQSDRAARVVDLNDYAVPVTSGSDGAVTGVSFNTTATNLGACPAGSPILIRGAGTGGIAFQTTVANGNGNTALILSSPAPVTVASGAIFFCGPDATAGITQALAMAQANGRAVRGRGAFWPAAQRTPFDLTYTSIGSDGGPVSAFSPFTQAGLVFLATGTSSPMFTPGVGGTFSATIYWPAQDGSAAAPLVYPAAFDTPKGGLTTNFTVQGATFVNAYDVFDVEPGGGAGRVFVNNTRMFCVHWCFGIRNGMADTLQFDPLLYIGPGVDPDSTTGNQSLRKYAAANAEFVHLDPAAADSNYPNMDGLIVTGGIIQGLRYALRVVSGVLDVSHVSNFNLDSTPTAVSVEGSAAADLVWSGGEIYSSQTFAPAAANDVFAINTSSRAVQLTLTGVHIPYAQGSLVHDLGVGFRRLTITGLDAYAWGQTTSTGATYYAVAVANNPILRANISGSNLDGLTSSGNASAGIYLGNAASAAVNGNTLTALSVPIAIVGSVGAASVVGNTTVATYGPASLVTSLTGTASLAGNAASNSFDKGDMPAALSGGTFSIPQNTAWQQFTQTSNVAAQIVNLPGVVQAGEDLVITTAGQVTALTFSPAVSGWTNGSMLAANSSLRLKGTAIAGRWLRAS